MRGGTYGCSKALFRECGLPTKLSQLKSTVTDNKGTSERGCDQHEYHKNQSPCFGQYGDISDFKGMPVRRLKSLKK